MKISYAITVCNEIKEIKNLLPFLIENKRPEDEVVILFDERNGELELLDYLLSFNKLPNVQTWRGLGWNNNFADWKNKLNEYCSGDFIFQLDADEMINKELMLILPTLFELNNEVEIFYLPRINTVDGITEEHIRKWNWRVDDNNRINYPDYQGRLFKKGLNWEGKVHEKIVGAKYYSLLPNEDVYSLIHHKIISKQEKQNELYNKI
jgi:glycosyltransferase involved in cell wall biosynthesis